MKKSSITATSRLVNNKPRSLTAGSWDKNKNSSGTKIKPLEKNRFHIPHHNSHKRTQLTRSYWCKIRNFRVARCDYSTPYTYTRLYFLASRPRPWLRLHRTRRPRYAYTHVFCTYAKEETRSLLSCCRSDRLLAPICLRVHNATRDRCVYVTMIFF